ncbi:hypothetical protein SDC9_181879 [bioreactor metagenome]|uniref:Uncharacterized protein n=1 Tax=bioreactor metagenome TaxID=1076179 RepID=A0A645H7B6_9ZZZZ
MFLKNCNSLVRKLLELSLEGEPQEELERLKNAIDVIVAFFSKERGQLIKDIIDQHVYKTGGFR